MSDTPTPLMAVALTVLASWPATGPTLTFLQLLLGPAYAAFSSSLLLGILDPADELVASKGRDVLPGFECLGIRGQRLAQVGGKLVHHPAWQPRAAHAVTRLACALGASTVSRR